MTSTSGVLGHMDSLQQAHIRKYIHAHVCHTDTYEKSVLKLSLSFIELSELIKDICILFAYHVSIESPKKTVAMRNHFNLYSSGKGTKKDFYVF